jgi:hypothetical protein
MPDVTATGMFSLPFGLAAALLAACPTFQSLVDAADEDAALAFIDYPYRDPEDDYLIPGAHLFDDESFEQFIVKKNRSQAGQIGLVIAAPVSEDYSRDRKNDLKEWRNTLSAIVDEIVSLAGTPAPGGPFYWNCTKVTKVSIGWARKSTADLDNDPTAEDSYRIGIFILDWV